MSSPHRQRPAFPDLVTILMQHAWLVLLYTVLCVAAIYILGRYATDLVIFVAIQLPAVIAVSAATFSTRITFLRIPLIWLVTAVLILTFFANRNNYEWTPIAFAVSALMLIAYCVWRSVAGTIRECSQRRYELGLPETIAVLIASWGAMVQISLLALMSIRGNILELLVSTEIGRFLVTGLNFITLTSPTAWFPAGLILLGITMLAALRFKEDPYRPLDFDDVLPTKSTGILAGLFAALRLPTWIAAIILEFLVHFVRQSWLSLKFFLDDWLGRLVLIVFSIAVPAAGLSVGHWCYWQVAVTVHEYLSEPQHFLFPSAAAFVSIHAFALVALSLYALSAGPLLMGIRPTPLKEAIRAVSEYVTRETLLASNAIGRIFSLFGILFIALPIASLLPGLPRFGPFSMIYSILVILALAYVLTHEIKRN